MAPGSTVHEVGYRANAVVGLPRSNASPGQAELSEAAHDQAEETSSVESGVMALVRTIADPYSCSTPGSELVSVRRLHGGVTCSAWIRRETVIPFFQVSRDCT